MGAEIVDEGAIEVNVTYICTKGVLASRDTTKTHGTVPTGEAGTTGEGGDITNLQVTTPQLKPIATRTEGTPHIAIIRITNRAGTEVHLNRRMIRGLRINSLPMEEAEEDIILGMMDHMGGQMGMLGGEEAHPLIEGEVFHRTVAVGMVIEEVREGGPDMVAMVVDTTIPSRITVMAGVATIEAVVITPVGVITLAGVINLAEAINLVEIINPAEAIIPEGVTSPGDRTAPALSLMEVEEGITREVVAVGGDTDHKNRRARR